MSEKDDFDGFVNIAAFVVICAGLIGMTHSCVEYEKVSTHRTAIEELDKTRRLRIETELKRARVEAQSRALSECIHTNGTCLVFETLPVQP